MALRPAADASAEARLAKRIGRYLVTGRIGRGGMGHVYRGLDEQLERELAIKTLTIEGSFDEESRKRFEIEAKASAKLQHPNIVTVFELGEDRGAPFIAMEMLGGADLESLMRADDPLLLSEKLEILIQVCRGLSFAHDHGIVHRDIKPSNIRVLEDGTAKIMDFGIAKLAGTGVTKTGMMVGTVHYMSPEQIRGKPLDGRSDVFSLGVILYELLAGNRPFVGEGATDVLYKIIQEPTPPLPPEALGGASPELQRIVEHALAKDADARYATANELADDLAKVLAEQQRAPTTAGADAATKLQVSRRLLKEGRVEECLSQLRDAVTLSPQSLDVRRALRAATREMQRRQRTPEAERHDEFPELEVTFKPEPTPTRRAPEMLLHPTMQQPMAPAEATPAPIPAIVLPAREGRGPLGAALGALAVALCAAGYLALRPAAPPQQENPEITTAAAPDESIPASVAPAPAALAVASEPSGARVVLDGQPQPGTTPLELRVDPSVDHRLQISADGYVAQEIALPRGGKLAPVRVSLTPIGPLGKVVVASAYPVDVLWRGKPLLRSAAGEVSLPVGKQVLTLVSTANFLRANVAVDVRATGVAGVESPALGKLNIRANPDNCRVSIDGIFVDYPPILDRSVAVGSHTVSFAWPDGSRNEQSKDVARGIPAYVMGRKD